ncbi:HAD family hydrolase [Emticicia sediminis]
MKNIIDYKVILWDFDGVIMDSMPIRGLGFKEVLKEYPPNQIEELMLFHEYNGGLSRYVKFRHFFEKIRGENVTEEQIIELSNKFSEIMLKLLLNEDLLISDSVDFIKTNYDKHEMHIVSGSDGDELRKICSNLNLSRFFKTINGSPTPKKLLVKDVLSLNGYMNDDVVLIGDSINDYEAAQTNMIDFCGYNNVLLKNLDCIYIEKFNLDSKK